MSQLNVDPLLDAFGCFMAILGPFKVAAMRASEKEPSNVPLWGLIGDNHVLKMIKAQCGEEDEAVTMASKQLREMSHPFVAVPDAGGVWADLEEGNPFVKSLDDMRASLRDLFEGSDILNGHEVLCVSLEDISTEITILWAHVDQMGLVRIAPIMPEGSKEILDLLHGYNGTIQ